MRDATPQTIYLSDYQPFGFLVDEVALTFDLDPHKTRVKSRILFRPNPAAQDAVFFLHGEDLKLVSAQIDGKPVTPKVTDRGLTCDVPDARDNSTGQVARFAQDRLACGDSGQCPCRRYAERMHRLADQIFTQHRPHPRAAVAPA